MLFIIKVERVCKPNWNDTCRILQKRAVCIFTGTVRCIETLTKRARNPVFNPYSLIPVYNIATQRTNNIWSWRHEQGLCIYVVACFILTIMLVQVKLLYNILSETKYTMHLFQLCPLCACRLLPTRCWCCWKTAIRLNNTRQQLCYMYILYIYYLHIICIYIYIWLYMYVCCRIKFDLIWFDLILSINHIGMGQHINYVTGIMQWHAHPNKHYC